MKYQKTTLKNGLRVIIAPMTDTQTATVLVMTGVGSRFESKSENGIAHFLEHMFFKGTPKRPTALDISHELDSLGAEFNAFTGEEYTGYYAKVAAKQWDKALDIISDLFLNAKLEAEEIERERGAILQEMSMYEDMPMRRVHEYFKTLLYGDTPLGRDIGGPNENIKAFKREDFVKFLNRGYVAENIVVGVAGNIDPKIVKKQVNAIFSTVQQGKKVKAEKVKDAQKSPQMFVKEKKVDQTNFVVGCRAYPLGHKNRPTLAVLASILGGGMSSRMFIEVRERRGLAYRVGSGTETFVDAGYLETHCGVDHKNLEKALQVVMDEYKKITKVLVSPQELKKAKEGIKGRMAMGLEGSDEVVEFLVGQEVLTGNIKLIKERMKEIDAVTAEDVLRVAKDIFQNRKLNLAIIAPKVDQKKLAEILRF